MKKIATTKTASRPSAKHEAIIGSILARTDLVPDQTEHGLGLPAVGKRGGALRAQLG